MAEVGSAATGHGSAIAAAWVRSDAFALTCSRISLGLAYQAVPSSGYGLAGAGGRKARKR